jgi:hypothetical protein
MFDHAHQDCFYRSHPYFNKDPTIEYALWGSDIIISMGDGILKNAIWIPLCTRTITGQACSENGHVWKILPGFWANL